MNATISRAIRHSFTAAVFSGCIAVSCAPENLDGTGSSTQTGITVTGLVAVWDSLKLETRLTWDRPDSAVLGYNVYRGVVDSVFSGVPYNQVPVVPNDFIDSAGLDTGKCYVYRIKAVDPKGDVSREYSNPDTVRAFCAYKQVREFTVIWDTSDIIVYKGIMFLASKSEGRIAMYDTSGQSMGFFGDTGAYPLVYPRALCAFDDAVYVADHDQSSSADASIKRYSLTGEFLWRSPNFGPVSGFAVAAVDSIYTVDSGATSVVLRDSNGTVLNSISLGYPLAAWDWLPPKIVMAASNIIVPVYYPDTMRFVYLNKDLTVLKRILCTSTNAESFSADSLGRIYLLLTGFAENTYSVKILEGGAGGLYARFKTFLTTYGSSSISVDQDLKIYVKEWDRILVYSKN
jgi:hypothetical protein